MYHQALLSAARGEKDKTLRLIEGAEKPYQYCITCAYALLGMRDEAVHNIQLGIDIGFKEIQHYLYSYLLLEKNPCFDNLRDDPLPQERQSAEDIIAKIAFSDELKEELSDETMADHRKNLAGTVVRFRDRLIELFQPESGDRNYLEMGRLLAKRGAVVEATLREFTWAHGENDIAGLFKSLPFTSIVSFFEGSFYPLGFC